MARLLRSEFSQHTSDHKPLPSSPSPLPLSLNQTTQQITKQNTIVKATETTHTMSSQQQQQQSKRKRDPSPATDESGPTKPQTTKAKVNDDKKIDGKFIHNTASL
jgi:hypothetical protein